MGDTSAIPARVPATIPGAMESMESGTALAV